LGLQRRSPSHAHPRVCGAQVWGLINASDRRRGLCSTSNSAT